MVQPTNGSEPKISLRDLLKIFQREAGGLLGSGQMSA